MQMKKLRNRCLVALLLVLTVFSMPEKTLAATTAKTTVSAGSGEASIGKKRYATLTKAIAAAKNGETIVLRKDVTYPRGLTIKKPGKTIYLNLNKKKVIAVKPIVLKTGTLHIKNGYLRTGSDSGHVLKVEKNARAILQNGSFYGTISNFGQLVIKKGVYRAPRGKSLLRNYAQMTINGGKFTGDKTFQLLEAIKGSLTVNNGDFTNTYGIFYDGTKGTLIINGGNFLVKGEKSTDLINTLLPVVSGKVIINQGKFRVINGNVIEGIDCRAELAINGGTFQADAEYFVVDYQGNRTNKVTVKGGNFKGRLRFSRLKSLELKGGTFRSRVYWQKKTIGKFTRTVDKKKFQKGIVTY